MVAAERQTGVSAVDANTDVFALSDTVKIGKNVYVIERHFSGERDIREAVYTAVRNEAFQLAEKQGA